MQEIFRDYLDLFIVIYLEDVLIYSKNPEEHERHLKLVLERLRNVQLFAKLEKFEFDCTTVEFLGYRVSPFGISMYESKVKA